MIVDVFNVPVGSVLQFQARTPEDAPRHNVKLVGYAAGVSLIVTTPTAKGKVQIIRPGQQFNVRVLRGNTIMGFVAVVLQSYVKPFPHLHLEFPKDVERILVRDAPRVSAGIFAVARNVNDSDLPINNKDVSLLDLSRTGAKLGSHVSLGRVNDRFFLNFGFEVADQQESMTLLAVMRNQITREFHGTNEQYFTHGVQF